MQLPFSFGCKLTSPTECLLLQLTSHPLSQLSVSTGFPCPSLCLRLKCIGAPTHLSPLAVYTISGIPQLSSQAL